MNSDPANIFNSRSPVMGQGGMVASSQPLATAAGLEILSDGGNAADAAVAVAAALNVTEPTSTGIGGDMFALYYEAGSGAISALNGSGRAPAALSLERVQKEGLQAGIPPFHPYTVTVPGACAGWCDLLERFGSLERTTILAPAIRLAEEGFPVEPITSHFWKRAAERQLKASLNGRELTLEGRGPEPGEIFRNPGLARTFQAVAEGGKRAYYEGEIAASICSVIGKAGGCMELEDLAVHLSTWEAPISANYGDLRLWECPPNGQGLTALIALNILAGLDLPADPLSTQRLHLEIEALRLAFADTRWYVADPAVVHVPVEELLSEAYAAERRRLIDPRIATLDQSRGLPVAGSDTVYFCTADKWGNACSFINSNYMGFGTGIVPSGWGFSLQNRGANFSLEAGHPNALAPRKRPYHTIIPAMITRKTISENRESILEKKRVENRDSIFDRKQKDLSNIDSPISNNGSLISNDEYLFSAFGVMGGFMQPQGHLQVFLALANGIDPQSALNLPRFCLLDGSASDPVALEDGFPEEVYADLAERGHKVQKVSGWDRALFGRGQVILRDPVTGVLTGGSDPRADGCAMTLI
jgi:gamma-glutamyltranspeptidase / glutathione hydrolase